MSQAPARLVLSKHEGAGNDFLVFVDVDDQVPLTEELALGLCDRRRGIGADGIIRIGPGRDGADVSMQLRNADGGPAETSGNGLRCLAQAAVIHQLVRPPHFTVATAAGLRAVDYQPGASAEAATADVEMGVARLAARDLDVDGHRARSVDMGNPHLVVWCDDPGAIDLEEAGPRLAGRGPEERNVEFVGPGPVAGELSLVVWERGVGTTLACGTGTCAAAAAAAAWGAIGRRVRVHNPGGVLQVTLGEGDQPIRLSGPVRKVADVVVTLPLAHVGAEIVGGGR
ncbi:MAG TPA: diaminopimelate epimerase [Acidimicrobiales bacterium]|nr:diaminopimelate epimerase [Acidimicrobiales bacterium]